MAPPLDGLHLDVDAVSGICGSISIACWVLVFTPQLIANWTCGSAEALSIQFIIVWLIGDVFNIAGAVLQGVLPTMIILAVYYTLADVVLLGQCFYYRGFTWRDEPCTSTSEPSRAHAGDANADANEGTALLVDASHHESDWTGLSPAVPHISHADPPPPTVLQTVIWNTCIVLMVCAAGILGWFLGQKAKVGDTEPSAGRGEDSLTFSVWGQVFGYLCAVFYIASRVPQLILNYRRKTTEGLSMLFFIFACLGNVTYVLSIVAYEPRCEHRQCESGEVGRIYGKYMLLNLSWLAGASVTLLMDFVVFCQYFYYNTTHGENFSRSNDQGEYVRSIDTNTVSDGQARPQRDNTAYDHRPLLQRGDSVNAMP
ncbi:hypothetical protein E4U24_000625 [Claviceps purpurea]|nr:hypothetical protein E4U24_000625 [Claviceps purpurea]